MRASSIVSAVFVLLALVCLPSTSYGRTWNVPVEAPTIQAGIDSASAGDTVLVACGTYYERNINMKADVCLRSETGQFDCVTIDAQQLGRVIIFDNDGSGSVLEGFTITGGTHSERGAGIRIYWYSSPTIQNCHIKDNRITGWNAWGNGIECTINSSPMITDCVISGNFTTQYGNAYGGGVIAYSECHPIFTNCTFYGNDSRYGCQVEAHYSSHPQFNNCILAEGIHGDAAYCYSSSSITLNCCDVYGNQGGDWDGCISGQRYANGNFTEDPIFCDANAGDYSLRSDSPCMGAPGCGLVGALGSGCRKPNHWIVPIDAPTIQAGIDSAAAGDTVVVKCGTYDENIEIDYSMTLLSETGEPDCVTIDGQSLGRVIEFSPLAGFVTLRGFTITGGAANFGAGIGCYSGGGAVTNCVVRENHAADTGGGIHSNAGGNAYYTDCIIADNTAAVGGGLGSSGAATNLVGCTFYGNDADVGSNLSTTIVTDTLTNCILSFATGAGDHVNCGAGTITLSCCDVYGNENGDYVGCLSGLEGSGGNFSADPAFCYAEAGDLHLHWTSPCIDGLGCGQVGALGLGCVARTWYVSTAGSDSTGDGTAGDPFLTIQHGLDRAFWGDTVEVACGTYFEHDITLRSGVLLTSATGTWDCVTVDAERMSRALEGTGLDSTTAITGFTVKHGAGVDSGAGMYLDYADIAVTNCWFDSSRADLDGGGIYAQNSAPTFTNCFFYADTADVGAAVSFRSSTPTLTDCIFSENHANYYGGAVCLSACTDFDISVCSAELNSSYYGGAVFCSASSGTIDYCGFRANDAGLNGGAVYAENGSNVTITNSLVYDNVTAGAGSGIWCNLSQADIATTTFYGNTASTGGGCVSGSGATLNLDNDIIAFGGGGGAVECAGGATVLTCCDVYANVGGDWVGCIAGQEGLSDNMSYDPLFCNVDIYDFHLAPYSPCLTGPCGQIGALGVGVDCLSESPMIVSVTDVGNDQGRQARLKWRRSAYDVPGNEMDIMGYSIFRRQDAHLAAQPVSEEVGALDARADAQSDVLVLKAEGWDQIDFVLAYGDSIYQAVVPTLCDSTDEGMCWSVFMVRATSSDPFTYFDSDPDSGYSIDNLAPAAPPGLIMSSPTELAWEEVPDTDFDYYSVYGSAIDVLDETATLIGYTIDTMKDVASHVYDYYHVTATDFSGNEGDESSVNNLFAGVPEIGDIPTAFALKQNRPNPFSTTTVVAFDLPEETNARIRIYDTHGRLIKRLTDGDYEAGRHAATWRGEDEAGRPVSPGVYFIRMEAGEFEDMKKVMLLR